MTLMKGWRPYVLIILIGTVVYAQTLFFGFSGLDDRVLILENHNIIKTFANAAKIFQSDPYLRSAPVDQYRPIHVLSFMLEAQLGGKEPLVYHFSNLLTHLLGACLVFILLLRLGYKRELSFIFAALFTAHPALSQAVAWIPGRNDSQLAIFVLLSFLCFAEFLEKRRLYLYIAHLLFFILALLTKETAVGLALICPLYVWLIAKEKRDKNLACAFSLLAITAVWLGIRHLTFLPAQGHTLFQMAASILPNS